MDLSQAGDWSGAYHLTVRLAQHTSNVQLVEYFWSHTVNIEKVIPTTAILTEPGEDGLYRIPLTKVQSRVGNCLVIRVAYTESKQDDRGLITAKHLTGMYTNSKGHEVRMVSILARAPFAWVKPHVPSLVIANPFFGDTVDGHRPESIVSRIYSAVDMEFRNLLFHVTGEDKDKYIAELVRDTLSRLAAPLAFKVVYEQSRLTLEHLRRETSQGADGTSFIEPERDLWGTSVLWILSSDITPVACTTVNQHDLWPMRAASESAKRSALGWVEVELTRTGLAISKRVSQAVTREVIDAPYWAVILTALCCGALDRWCSATEKLLGSLKVDAKQYGRVKELCQRCGHSYRDMPIACPEEPKRVLIDKVLFGDLCTSLCARKMDTRTQEPKDQDDALITSAPTPRASRRNGKTSTTATGVQQKKEDQRRKSKSNSRRTKKTIQPSAADMAATRQQHTGHTTASETSATATSKHTRARKDRKDRTSRRGTSQTQAGGCGKNGTETTHTDEQEASSRGNTESGNCTGKAGKPYKS
ncbi:tumor necrosis factor receptor superfamily member 14 [Sarotherodon galilaeus]